MPIKIGRLLLGSTLLLCSASGLYASSKLFEEWKTNPKDALLPDFSRAGYHFGNSELPDLNFVQMPVYHVDAYGAVPNDDESDQAAIQRAIDEAALAGGGIVRFRPGTYIMGKGDGAWSIMIRHSNIILQGAGSDQTTLFSPGQMNRNMGPWTAYPMILVAAPELKGQELQYGYGEGQPPIIHDWYTSSNPDESAQAKEAGKYFYIREKDILTKLSADAERNTRTVTVRSAQGLHPGQRVVMVLRDRGAARELLKPWDASRFSYLNWDGYGGNGTTANLVRQIMTVEHLEGNRVRFFERLRWDFPLEHDPVLLRYPHIEQVGVEGLKLKGVVWDGVPQTKTGLYLVNAADSWIRDVKFINLKTALNITQSKNVTAVDVTLDGEDGKTGSYFEGFHNSMKFLSHSSDCLIERGRILRGVTHGFSCQRHASGNVFLDCELPPVGTDGMNSRIDFHAQLPMANLYDRLENGNLKGSGGNIRSQPHSGPRNVLWNWDSEIAGQQTIWAGYGEFRLQIPGTIWVGLEGKNEIDIQFTDGARSARTEEVVVESNGRHVEPASLYRAQVRHRLGRDPGPGIYPFIEGPNVIFTGQPATWSAGGTQSTALFTQWNRDSASRGTSFTSTLTNPGQVTLEMARTDGQMEPIIARKDVRVLAPNGILVDARAEDFMPVSRNVLRTANGTLLQVIHTGQHFALHLSGESPYFRSVRHVADKLTVGSLIVTSLPAEGVDLSDYAYQLAVENVSRNTLNTRISLVARDTGGNWAMSKDRLGWDTDEGNFRDVQWEPLHSTFNLKTGSFDEADIDRIGFLMLLENEAWTLKDNKLRFKGFRVFHRDMP